MLDLDRESALALSFESKHVGKAALPLSMLLNHQL